MSELVESLHPFAIGIVVGGLLAAVIIAVICTREPADQGISSKQSERVLRFDFSAHPILVNVLYLLAMTAILGGGTIYILLQAAGS